MSFHRTKWRQKWPTFILIALITIVSSEEPDTTQPLCTHGGCYPATGNLLIGRDNNLSATSTCGMTSSQEYCIVSHLSEYEKCFLCDSRDPQQRGSHRIQNVIYLAGPAEEKTWWQSENGLESVSVRLDLEAEFHFTHLILKFKTFRPAAMLIERSADFGRTWKVYRYFSYNCTKMFPGVPVHALQKIDDVICDQRYSDIEPSTEGEVIFKVLDPAIKVEDPYSVEIQELLQITNLRINFTKLHTLGDNLLDQRPEVLHKYYYAVYELVVRGSCFCYGHASECSPVEGIEGGVEGMIHGRCVCKHRTTGLNCELCQDFFHDLPWRPAEADDPHSCKRCNCNHHATICHFDPAVFLATGGQSGGVCDDCQHNTMGRNCELCKPFYYLNPWSDIRAETACVQCDCDPVGSLDGGICDGLTDVDLGMIAGQCRCKENVRGERCDSCRDNFYGLSRNDPLGCQPCQCDPRGIVAGNSPCDQISGDCYCKRFVTGRYCNQCLPEFWGLSNDVMGCRPCDCDFGGAYNNRCSLEDGQCDCRADITGRYCGAVIPGYFCMPLDYYTYEAETARGLSATDPQTPGDIRPESPTDCVEYYNAIQNGKKVRLRRHRGSAHITFRPAHILRATNRRARQLHQKADIEIIRREHSTDHMITWTGPGFARVRDGAGLLFHIDNIPIPMDYDIMIRYEPESAEDWEVIVTVTSHILPMSPRCGNTLPSEQMYRNKLPHSERYLLLPKPFCFENNNQYEISIRFQRLEATNRHPGSFILIDSLVLLPKVYELPGFLGNDPASTHRRQEMETYRCLESFKMATMPTLAETCVTMLCSISAIIHDGALPCLCDLQGSLSAVCDKIGGQCMCKPNVIGRRCDQCAPGTFGFGPTGCSKCECDPQASISRFCNPVTGQCQCQGSVAGRRCSQCPPGQYGFPHCKPCQCNGHSEECDPRSGACANCRDFTSGRHCDKCLDGYYGDPVLGSGQQCRPCPCPGYPGTHNYHGSSCYADRDSAHILCLCAPGYTGSRCDLCSPGYYGNADQDGGECRPCQCNNNIDPSDPESCDARSGICLNCLHNTDGHHCAECKADYYGNAILRNCRRCSCNELGTMPSHCTRDTCYCDRVSGHCACRANVIGRNCDQCAANYWNFGADLGCEPCACQPEHSLRQDCNVYTGQCHCRAGFGGRICSQCQEDYWGDPKTRCEACSCDPVGSEIRSCDHGSGLCRCREGFSGRQCDQCDRGFRDNYPLCSACHQCFNQWDASITRLQDQLRVIHSKISDLQHGVQAPETSNLRDLEDKLRIIKHMMGEGSLQGSRMMEPINKLVNKIKTEVAQLSYQIHSQEKKMNETQSKDQRQRRKEAELHSDLTQLNVTIQILQSHLEATAINETYRILLTSFLNSSAAQRLANHSVYGAASPASQSQQTREETQRLLTNQLDRYRKNMAAYRTSLTQLKRRSQELNVSSINTKICGAPGDKSCDQALCGGANCKDDQGRRKCGGEKCHGAVPVSGNALVSAHKVRMDLENMATQLNDISEKIQEVQAVAQEAKVQSESTLSKAKDTKRRMEDSTERLRTFIKKIKDFLTEEGADPESIELVARQVLNISLPTNPGDLTNLINQINQSIGNISRIETILNITSESVDSAKHILQQALEAREKADGMRGKITESRSLLNRTTNTSRAAERAINTANQTIRRLKSSLEKSMKMMTDVEGAELSLMDRLIKAAAETETLRKKMESNRQTAERANQRASNAMLATEGLDKEMDEVRQSYGDLREKVIGLDVTSGSDLEKVRRIKDEAQDLLRKTTEAKDKLEKIQQKFQENEDEMISKTEEIRILENKTSELLTDIRKQSNIYATC